MTMADDTTERDHRDRDRINFHDDYDSILNKGAGRDL
jgi:hypothetical protein